ncbi:MAG: cation:dicarboxylase symporter family transporter, partial [Clostridia bacterium]|nr:cation:dicarboxylase symporter family transporter [Clostridia bacterium]
MKVLKVLRGIAGAYNRVPLILRILCGIILGVILAFVIPNASGLGLLGDLFVGALKAIAPLLVFLLVISALSQGGSKLDKRFGMVIFFYLLTTFIAAIVAV